MNPQEHAEFIGELAKQKLIRKYMRGQAEHGGRLWEKKGLIDMAIEEAIDQVVYLLTLKDQLDAAGVELGVLDESQSDTPEVFYE